MNVPVLAALLLATSLVGGCWTAPVSVRERLSSADEVRVTKYTWVAGGNKTEIRLLGKPEVERVVRLLRWHRVYYASGGMTQYALEFRSASGETLGTVDVMGRGVEWYLEGVADHPYAVTDGLMNYLDALFAP